MCKKRVRKGKKMPSQERRNEIENIVIKLLENEPELNKPAFDIVSYLINNEKFAIASSPMNDGTTGMLFVDDNNKIKGTNVNRLILINSLLKNETDFVQRRRFIIAHEYGHFLLHKNAETQFAHRDTKEKDSLIEREADFFARCLLMPKATLLNVLNIELVKNMSIEEKISFVARVFNVTKKKANDRLLEVNNG